MIEETPGNLFQWAQASLPHPGETNSGDLLLLIDRPKGPLVSVMDGLGHGDPATEAAETAANVIRRNPEAPIRDLIAACHNALRGTRGIAITLADVEATRSELTWAGIGNVEGRLLRCNPGIGLSDESVLLRGGVVGYQIPDVRPTTVRMDPGDVVIFATDGISPSFGDGVILNDPPDWIAQRIMSQHSRRTDDALVVVGRYLGIDHE